jgi:DNA-binding transcriptional MerR regulator
LAVTRETAARVARLSVRQIDYWASTGLLEPTTDRRLSPGRRVRLYSFVDLLALLVASELRARNVSVQHIRAVVDHLRSRGYDRPLTQVVFATLNGRVYFQHDDGSWEVDVHPDQLVIQEVLNLIPLRNRIDAATRRDDAQVGQVERRRGAMGSKLLIAGTRVPVGTVRRYLEAGRTTAQVLESFPVLSAADVEGVRRGAA